MTDLSPRARDLVADARRALEPEVDRVARGRDRLLAATAAGAVVTVVSVTAAHGAAAAPAVAATTGVAGLKLIAIGVSLAVLVSAAVLVPRLYGARPPATATATAQRTQAPRAIVPTAAPTIEPPTPIAAASDLPLIELEPNDPPAPRPTRPTRPIVAASVPVADAVPATAPEPVPATDPLTRELSMLRAAKARLHAGAPVDALSIVAAYQREFPRGQLAEEAAALELDLLCAAGRADEVARNRARFLDRWPSSALRQRVERACKR